MAAIDVTQFESANREARQRIADLKLEIAKLEVEVTRRAGQIEVEREGPVGSW